MRLLKEAAGLININEEAAPHPEPADTSACAASIILRQFRGRGGTCPQLPGLGGGRGPWSRGEDSTTWTVSPRWPELWPSGCPAAGPSEAGRRPQPTEPTSLLPRSSTRLPPEMPPPPGSPPGRPPPASCTPLYSRAGGPDPARRGWAAPGPSRSGRPGRTQVSEPKPRREGGVRAAPARRPSSVGLGRPRVASAGATCSEDRWRLGGAAWEAEADARTRRGRPRDPARTAGPETVALRGRPSPTLVRDPIPAAGGLCSRNEG